MASPALTAVEIIRDKRDGKQLTPAQIEWFIAEYARDGAVSDAQASALAMAIYFQGLSSVELSDWTASMIGTGDQLDLSQCDRPSVDKHSTGGVGDKISLVLVPLVAACGASVPQLSGRGLGITGGTLDKLEAIPGWRAHLTNSEATKQLSEIGALVAGTSKSLVPADRKLYALRDATATVASIPLIASSIMSKKIAEGVKNLVLDVKAGDAAFMPDVHTARELAQAMVMLGQSHGVETRALITSMDDLIGQTAGNALEVAEACTVLQGGGPSDVVELTLALATEMLELTGISTDPAPVLASGAAYEVFCRMVAAQGGRLKEGLPTAPFVKVLTAEIEGWVTGLSARAIGETVWNLGAGRARQGDRVSATAGVRTLVSLGDWVGVGEPILEIHADHQSKVADAQQRLSKAVVTSCRAPKKRRIVLDRIVSP